jgi:NAD(P)-dependent dehydrogenase (short-subunit alcohol dehydrogenase family)
MVDNMNQYDFAGRVAVVTGGTRGLGYSIAERMLLSGASVSLWDLDAAKLADAAKQLASQGAVDTAALDLTESATVQAATEATVARFGKIDILINNAGITGGSAATWEIDPAAWRRVIDVNVVGSFLTSRSVVPVMLGQGYGRIVNMASVAGKEGNP